MKLALDVLKKLNRKTIALTGDLNSDIKNHADVVIGYVDEEKEGFVTKGVTTLALFLMKLTFAILKKQGKEVDTAWFDDYCESFASIQKENFVREEAFLENFRTYCQWSICMQLDVVRLRVWQRRLH